MPTVSDHISLVQSWLHDSGDIWSRAELLNYLNDGYRALLTQSQAVLRFTALPVPGTFTYSTTQDWEARYANGGTVYTWTWQADTGGYAASSLWEVEQLEGVQPTSMSEGVCYQWERVHLNPTHTYYRFALPRNHERIRALWFDNELLLPLAVRELDAQWRHWMSLSGEPLCWTQGVGPNRTVELYEIHVTNAQSYAHVGAAWPYGFARRVSGARTYTAVPPAGDSVPVGIMRHCSSPERQYLGNPASTDAAPYGVARAWASSDNDGLLLLEVIGPEVPDLVETDTPALIPQQLQKYLRYYCLYRAFNRQGESYTPSMAEFCRQRFERGVEVLRALSWLSRRDLQYARQPARGGVGRMPRPRLPSTYPRVQV